MTSYHVHPDRGIRYHNDVVYIARAACPRKPKASRGGVTDVLNVNLYGGGRQG